MHRLSPFWLWLAIALAMLTAQPSSAQTPYLVEDINPGGDSVLRFFPLGPDDLLFRATHETDGAELWITDGTPGGTMLVKDIEPGTDGPTGREVWKSDGTTKVLVADIAPMSASSFPGNFSEIDGLLYFFASEPATGQEMWRTNGSVGNAERVTDVNPGPGGSLFLGTYCGVNGQIVFTAQDASSGPELWTTDGTPDTETLLVEVEPGPGSGVEFQSLRCAGGLVYFEADDGVLGLALAWTARTRLQATA